MTYTEYKQRHRGDDVRKSYKPQPPTNREEYLILKKLVCDYEDEEHEKLFNNEDIQLFRSNFERTMDDLLYVDDDFPTSLIEDFAEWRKNNGEKYETIDTVVSKLENMFDELMHYGHPHYMVETGNVKMEISLHDHSVTVYLFVAAADNYDEV